MQSVPPRVAGPDEAAVPGEAGGPAGAADSRLGSLDLNLLVTLDALLAERSVRGAAARLRLTEPAVSRALGRIRRAMGDQVLVRSGNTMIPTPRALAAQAEVHELVHRAHAVFAPAAPPDLASLTRTFTILSQDSLVAAIGVDLLDGIARDAPGVRVRFQPEPSRLDDPLRDGSADLELGGIDSTAPEIRTEILGYDRVVAVMRAGHPLATGPLTPEGLASARHVTVSRRGRLRGPLDDALAERGLRRTVAVSVTSYTAALVLLTQSDLVGLASRRLGHALLDTFGLVTREIGLALPAVTIAQAWHPRFDADGPHRWLRTRAAAAIRSVLSET
jgi:DNA-binding transcriptional LysR family regulator